MWQKTLKYMLHIKFNGKTKIHILFKMFLKVNNNNSNKNNKIYKSNKYWWQKRNDFEENI